jgi:hypothetical protein
MSSVKLVIKKKLIQSADYFLSEKIEKNPTKYI